MIYEVVMLTKRIGRYYGNWKEHLTFNDDELAAINKAIDDIKAAL